MLVKKVKYFSLLIGLLCLIFVLGTNVFYAEAATSTLENIKIAVVRFEDRSGSGLANVGAGVADRLVEELVNQGFTVLERQELESILAERNLNPAISSNLAQAGRIIGANALIAGAVTKIDITETSVSLGFIKVSGATVTIDASFRIISPYTSQIMAASSITTQDSGQTGLTLAPGRLISTLTQARTSVCTGGFLTDKNSYYQGEVINFGYRDPTPMNWFWVRIPSVGWVSSPSSSSLSAPCVTWTYSTPPLSPGTYTAQLQKWVGGSWTTVLTRNFSINLGSAPPAWVNEITVGTKQFADTIVGKVMDQAINQMTEELSAKLAQVGPQLLNQEQAYTGGEETSEEEATEGLKCRVVSVEGNTIWIGDIGEGTTCGTQAGVGVDDIFLVYTAKQLVDPNTGQLIELVPLEDQPKGKIIVTDVYQNAARAQKIGQFVINPNDLVIRKQ